MCVKEKNNQITESEGVDMQRNCTILTRQEMENLQRNLGHIIDHLTNIKNGEHIYTLKNIMDEIEVTREMIKFGDEITEFVVPDKWLL